MSELAFAVVAIALVVIAAVAVRKRNARPEKGGESRTLEVTRFIAVAYAGLTLLFTGISVIATLTSDAVDVTIPVRQFWPEPYPWVEVDLGPTAQVIGGGFAHAEVVASGLGTDARLLLAAGHAVQGLTFALIAVVVALLCHRLLSGMAFRPVLSRSVNVAAVAIAVGGVLWQVLFHVGGSIASAQVLTISGWISHEIYSEEPGVLPELDPFATGMPQPGFGVNIDLWPIMLGLALAAVAAAFRYGERLQRDTEGLV